MLSLSPSGSGQLCAHTRSPSVPAGGRRNGLFLREAHRLRGRVRSGDTGMALRPMRLFPWSNAYLALLFLAVPLSPLLR